MFDLISLGEIMLRMQPPGSLRLRQTDSLEVRVCGSQFNLAADLAQLGRQTAFLTRLPQNELGRHALMAGSRFGVDMSQVDLSETGRMGVIYVEFAPEPRRMLHIYDRQHSAASSLVESDYDWQNIARSTRLVYCDGIFPALNDGCAGAVKAFLTAAADAGCTVCFDVNFRQSLATVQKARRLYDEILPLVDILVTNQGVSQSVLDIKGDDEQVLQRTHERYGTDIICLTSRDWLGSRRAGWSSMAWADGNIYHGKRFEFEVVDRFGTGDAFFAGFLHAHLEGREIQNCLTYGNACCALAHTVEGDTGVFSAEEADALLDDHYSLQMNR